MANLMYHTEFMAKNNAIFYGTKGQVEVSFMFILTQSQICNFKTLHYL